MRRHGPLEKPRGWGSRPSIVLVVLVLVLVLVLVVVVVGSTGGGLPGISAAQHTVKRSTSDM